MSKKTTNNYDLIMICMTIHTVPDLLICFKPGEAAYAIFVDVAMRQKDRLY